MIAVLGLVPSSWKLAAGFGAVLLFCLYLRAFRDYSEKVRFAALVGLVGIPCFLLGNFIVVVPSKPLWQLTSTVATPTQAATATAYILTPTDTPTPSPTPTFTPTPTPSPTPTFTPTPTSTPEICGTYEWQWAGENWYGRIDLGKINDENIITQARVGLIEKTREGWIWMDGKVLELAEGVENTFEITDSGIVINLMVDKKNRQTGEIVREALKGTLQQVQCFAGRITYSGELGTYYGDMILVDYRSDFAPLVDDKFIPGSKLDWFQKYLIDCE
jgi:hypothetical protein